LRFNFLADSIKNLEIFYLLKKLHHHQHWQLRKILKKISNKTISGSRKLINIKSYAIACNDALFNSSHGMDDDAVVHPMQNCYSTSTNC
jgi:hypothetical protein